jgi:hypothetical protein
MGRMKISDNKIIAMILLMPAALIWICRSV